MSKCHCPYHPWGCFGHPTECRCAREGAVTIPRAKLEALMAAKKAARIAQLFISSNSFKPRAIEIDAQCILQELDAAIESVRAAGIDLEEKHD